MSTSDKSRATAERMVRCPGCGQPAVYSAGNPYRPFCSARCKNADFGAWASENYGVAAEPDPDDPDASTTPQAPSARH